MSHEQRIEPDVEARLAALYGSAPIVPAPARLRDAVAGTRATEPTPRPLRRAFDPIPRPFAALVGLAAAIVLVAGTATYLVTRQVTPGETGSPRATEPPDVPVSASATTPQGVTITITSPRSRVAELEVIPVKATLRYDGPAQSITVYGSGSGLVTYFLQRTGSKEGFGQGVTADCAPHVLQKGVETVVPFHGGFGTSGNAADDEFVSAHLRWGVSQLVLPAGRWQVSVGITYSPVPCEANSFVSRAATIEVTVGGTSARPLPSATPSASPSTTAPPSGTPPRSATPPPTAQAAPAIRWQSASFPNGRLFVANGRVWSFGRRILSSADGQHWDALAAMSDLVSGPNLVLRWTAVAEDGRGGLVAFATEESAPGSTAGVANPVALYSPDGRQWTRTEFVGTVDGTATLRGTMVAAGSMPGMNVPRQAAIWWSTDQSALRDATIEGGDGLLYAYAPVVWHDRLYALGMSNSGGVPSSVLLTSSGGRAWQNAGPLPGTAILLVAGSDRLVALGEDPRGTGPSVWTSTDGSTWTAGAIPSSGERQTMLAALLHVNGGFVALGSGIADAASGPNPGAAWVSADGSSWTLSGGTPQWDQAVFPGVAFGGRVLLPDATGSRPDDTRETVGGWVGTLSNP